MHKPGRRCDDLIETTASALPGGVVALMLLAVQRDNLELSINQAVSRYVATLVRSGTRTRGALSHYRSYFAIIQGYGSTEEVMKLCLLAFPSIWVSYGAVL